jgi:hypothetical protein
MMAVVEMTDQEQLLLELVNRSRANPAAEASRWGIDLNQDLEPGEISNDPKQPLAPHQSLVDAARVHADDMLAREFFDHVNPDGIGPSDRAKAAGYPVGAGENIAWFGTPGFLDRNAEVTRRHEALFLSPPHRTNMMNAGYRELGNGIRFGLYEGLNSIMVAESFGNRGGDYFITGVVYTDTVTRDNFYSIGESISAVQITATRNRDGAVFTTSSGPSGGYGMQVPTGIYTVTASSSKLATPLTFGNVVVLGRNTKIDFNTRLHAVGSIAGIAYDDRDADGVRDSGEPVLAGRYVYLDANDDGIRSPDETSVATDATGAFRFNHLLPGSYVVRHETPAGWESTGSEAGWLVSLASGQNRSGLALGSEQVNKPPIAQPDSYTTDQGLQVLMDVFANDSDPDGQLVLNMTQIKTTPQHGDVGLEPNEGILIYTPSANYVGEDFFEYTVVDDGGLESNVVRVRITVNPGAGTSWRNSAISFDTNNDGFVSSIDALLILDSINLEGSRRLRFPTGNVAPPPFYDVSGDAFVSPIDALLVLNELNRIAAERRGAASAQSTAAGTRAATKSTTPDVALWAAAVDELFDRNRAVE